MKQHDGDCVNWHKSPGKIQFQSYCKKNNIKKIGAYLPFRGEINISDLFSDSAIYMPQVNGQELCFAKYHEGCMLVKNKFGIMEPKSKPMSGISSLDLLLVPCIAITDNGFRLGSGGGYYDRLLEGCNVKSFGCVFDWQVYSNDYFAIEKHDMAMNGWLSPTQLRIVYS